MKLSPFEDKVRVFQRFKQVCATNLPLNKSVLKEKAKQIACKLGTLEFTASSGRRDCFTNRYDSSYVPICGDRIKNHMKKHCSL